MEANESRQPDRQVTKPRGARRWMQVPEPMPLTEGGNLEVTTIEGAPRIYVSIGCVVQDCVTQQWVEVVDLLPAHAVVRFRDGKRDPETRLATTVRTYADLAVRGMLPNPAEVRCYDE